MSAVEKAKAKTGQTTGKAEKEIGRTVGNERLEADGVVRESKGNLRDAKEKGKDTLKD
ncbi:CsbD family protein [Streptomyces sp. NPDC054765]